MLRTKVISAPTKALIVAARARANGVTVWTHDATLTTCNGAWRANEVAGRKIGTTWRCVFSRRLSVAANSYGTTLTRGPTRNSGHGYDDDEEVHVDHVLEEHAREIKRGLITETQVQKCYIRKYSEIGDLEACMKIFNNMLYKDTETVNMILGLLARTYPREAISTFNKLILQEALLPDKFTFRALLLACDNGGLVDEAKRLILLMDELGLAHKDFTTAAMIGALGKRDNIAPVHEYLQRLDNNGDASERALRAYLTVCRLKGAYKQGVSTAAKLLNIKKIRGTYTELSKLHFQEGYFEKASNQHDIADMNKLKKNPGKSFH